MLRGTIICPDQEVAGELANQLSCSGRVGILRTLSRYPDQAGVVQFMKAVAPEVIFIGVEQLNKLESIVAAVKTESPHCQLVGIGRSADQTVSALDVQNKGVQEFLSFPFDTTQMAQVIDRVSHFLAANPATMNGTDNVFAFLPGKPGAGASTLATNVAIAASRMLDGRGFLIDCDRGNGIVRFLLQIEKQLSLMDAVRNAFQLDETVWPQLVTPYQNLDVMHADSLDPDFRVEPIHVRQILEYARRLYSAVFVDLSGIMEPYAVEAMLASKRIFLVVTPELASIYMARHKMRYLNKVGLGDRVDILISRSQKKTVVNKENIEDLLQRPVLALFPNDYQRVNFAVTMGKEIDAECDLGRQFQAFAAFLLDRNAPVSGSKKRFADFLFAATKEIPATNMF